jgi:hypothetical protein
VLPSMRAPLRLSTLAKSPSTSTPSWASRAGNHASDYGQNVRVASLRTESKGPRRGSFRGRAPGPGGRQSPGPLLGRYLTVQGQMHFGDHCRESLPLRLRDRRRHRTCSSSEATRSKRAWRLLSSKVSGGRFRSSHSVFC